MPELNVAYFLFSGGIEQRSLGIADPCYCLFGHSIDGSDRLMRHPNSDRA